MNDVLVEYQRRYMAGEMEPVTCAFCFGKWDILNAMYLRYNFQKDQYYFECFGCNSVTIPGMEFFERLKKEMKWDLQK